MLERMRSLVRPHNTGADVYADLRGSRFDQVKALQYATAPEAPAYRAIIEVFARAKRRYRVQLRPSDIVAGLERDAIEPRLTDEQVHARLKTLCEWGNLVASHDAGAAEKLDDYYRRAYVYRLTGVGEAAHEAVVAVERAVEATGALQTTMLQKIREALATLEALGAAGDPDPDRAKRAFDDLHAAFDSLSTEASRFMSEVQRFLDDEHVDAEAFQLRKTALVAYLQGFVDRLVGLGDPIRRSIRAVDAASFETLLETAAQSSDLPPSIDQVSPRDAWQREQRERWSGIVGWFVAQGGESVERELLRVANASVSQLVHTLHRLRERVARRVDRSADFRQLGRWFARCGTDDEAHVLFTRAFGLHGARHFHLAENDPDLVTPRTSWWDAQPVAVPVQLRRRGTAQRGGRTGRVPDFESSRMWLRQKRLREQEQRDAAVRAMGGSSGGISLSDLPRLDAHGLDILLELLDAGLLGELQPDGRRRGDTEDGRYIVSVRQVPDTSPVPVETSEGRLTSPRDIEIQVEVRR